MKNGDPQALGVRGVVLKGLGCSKTHKKRNKWELRSCQELPKQPGTNLLTKIVMWFRAAAAGLIYRS